MRTTHFPSSGGSAQPPVGSPSLDADPSDADPPLGHVACDTCWEATLLPGDRQTPVKT